ncbi:hypothetical protein [Aquabacterium sp.]|uniref:hypothetical protein n=1 Tax=Aquabacterium sp. TaxID=1872578 RepID=UPI0035B174D2
MINANKAAKAEGMNLQQMAVRVAIEEQKSIVAIARARGDNYTATQAENEIKRLEIQLVQLSAEAKRAEAKSVLAGVEATRAQLVASGQLTPFKRAELDALTAKARAMEKEAEIGEITAKRMKALAEISQQAGSSSAGAAGGFDKLASSIEGVGNAAGSARDRVGQMNRAVELAKRQSHTNGSVTYDQNDALQTLVNKQRAGTLTADDLSVAEAANSAAQANLQMMQQNMAAYSIDGQNSTRAAAMQAQQIVEAIKGMSMGSTGQVTQQAASSTQTTATTSTVVIKLGGETASVSTASQSDADSLTGMLKKLGSYVSRS